MKSITLTDSGVPIDRLYQQSFDSGQISRKEGPGIFHVSCHKHQRISVIVLEITQKIPYSSNGLHTALSVGPISVIYRCNILI